MKPIAERIADADVLASRYLADGNEAAEGGDMAKAEKLWAKSGFWRDRYNLLTNAAEKPAPGR